MTTHGVAARSTAPGSDPGAIESLRQSVRGEVITGADAGYDTHRRVWNGSIDRRPRVIVRCTGVDDVRAAVGFGREHDLPIALRGGGHSFPGLSTCDDGVLVDLRPMDQIQVDPETRMASAEAGMLLGEVDLATQRYGRPSRRGSCRTPVSPV
jgi:FAD/FMN-containing dehydrogenase